ncbi:hypothetical protein FSP39_022993 [Pinctada imbricata]|uniref:Uncharacterized protein n=1 Tax=Pinctada imbricata TaxID=66713 RepID=A0AA88YPF9_PINIB|nr:hypothetical protein FSP39_022993 [Pinctada imbricata]
MGGGLKSAHDIPIKYSLSDKQLMDMIMRMNRYDMDIPPSMFLSNSLLRPAMTSMQYPARQSAQSDMSFLFPLMAFGGDAFEF